MTRVGRERATRNGLNPATKVFAGAVVYLVVAWLLSYAGDVHGFLGLGQRLANRGAERPFVWYYLFMEGSPTEWLQWGFLAAAAGLAFYLAGWSKQAGYAAAARGLRILGVGLGLMLMEDAGNLRHQIKFYVRLVLGRDTMALGIAVEMVFFAFLGVIMVYFLARYWRLFWRDPVARVYLGLGYGAYAAAALASATRHIGDWYDHAGAQLLRWIGVLDAFESRFVPTDVGRPIGFYVMDFLMEESIELIAAAALCAAMVALNGAIANDRRILAPHRGVSSRKR